MSLTIREPAFRESLEQFPGRRRWTRGDLRFLHESGLLDGHAWELVDGEVIARMGQGMLHSWGVSRVLGWLYSLFGTERVATQASIDVAPEDCPTSEPQPDALVLRDSFHEVDGTLPQARDIALVVEVSDSSLPIDLGAKARLYARAGIPEFWVLDVRGRRLVLHREPGLETYGNVRECGPDAEVICLLNPAAPVRVSSLLPPATAG